MKNDLHPTYNLCEVSCVCGNAFQTRSIKPVIKVEVCSACHPFFTGKQKLVDTAGRVDKFRAKMEASKKMKEAAAKKAESKKSEEKPKVEASTPAQKAEEIKKSLKATAVEESAESTQEDK